MRRLFLACLLPLCAGLPLARGLLQAPPDCPEHTAAPPGAASVLDCACDPGYDCAYLPRLQAIATLNATLRDFLDDAGGLQTAFVEAMSAAAAVAADRVVVQGAVDRAALPGAGARRLLALGAPLGAMPTARRFAALEATGEAPYDDPAWAAVAIPLPAGPHDEMDDLAPAEPDDFYGADPPAAPAPPGPIHVFAAAHGATELRALDAELARRAPGLHLAHRWDPDHRVLPRRRAGSRAEASEPGPRAGV